jgi:hypothetical protein
MRRKEEKMSGTVDYPKVVDHLTDVIKELNRPCATPKDPKESAKRAAEERRRDAAKLLRALLRALEQKPAASGAAAAERSAGALRSSWLNYFRGHGYQPDITPFTENPKDDYFPDYGFEDAELDLHPGLAEDEKTMGDPFKFKAPSEGKPTYQGEYPEY